jgi:hypothetical protein
MIHFFNLTYFFSCKKCRYAFSTFLVLCLLLAFTSHSEAQDGTTWPTFSTKGLAASKGLNLIVQHPPTYEPVPDNVHGYLKVFAEASESGDSFYFMSIGVSPLPGNAASSSFMTDESWDKDKLHVLWSDLAKSLTGVNSIKIAYLNWGQNPAARISILESDGEFVKNFDIQYAIFNDSLVKLECGVNRFGTIEDYPEGFLSTECSTYFNSLASE